MKIGRFLWIALVFLASVAIPSAHAEQPGASQSGRRVALVVGNGTYHSTDHLANPPNDARLIAATLQAAGFTLVGGGPQIDLDKSHFDRLVQEFGRQLPGAEVALFYYSGHGMQVEGENWLVPVDANPTGAKDLDFQMVDASLVLRQMEDAGTKLNLLILDACRNNPYAVRGIRGASGGLAQMSAPEGTLISYATQPGNVAYDGTTGNSPYSTALADAMRRPGLELFRVFNQVGLSVKQVTGGAQQPWLASSPIAGNFFFFTGPVTITPPAAPIPLPALPTAPSLATRRFDGIWEVELVCPTEGVAAGYAYHFNAQVAGGALHGEHGVASEPGALSIDGTLADDGTGLLRANGRTGRIEHNIRSYKSAPPGTPYAYDVSVHFDGAQGSGSRLGGARSCTYNFRKS